MGFDILSKNNNGKDMIYRSENYQIDKRNANIFFKKRMEVCSNKRKRFFLYRVFNFVENPQLFIKQGSMKIFVNFSHKVLRDIFN